MGCPERWVDAPSLEAFKARQDGALSNLTELKMSLLTAEWVGLSDRQRSLPTQTIL